MERLIKYIKDEEGNDIEVYSDICNACNAEMIFPKQQADEIETMFPFIKKKFEQGTVCLKCAIEQEQKFNIRLFSDEEIKILEEGLKDEFDD